jgi:hypothetical protein
MLKTLRELWYRIRYTAADRSAQERRADMSALVKERARLEYEFQLRCPHTGGIPLHPRTVLVKCANVGDHPTYLLCQMCRAKLDPAKWQELLFETVVASEEADKHPMFSPEFVSAEDRDLYNF